MAAGAEMSSMAEIHPFNHRAMATHFEVRIADQEKTYAAQAAQASFDLLDKRYVWVIGEDHVAHQRLITVQHELEDTLVVQSGLDAKDKIVLDGVLNLRDGDKVKYDSQ